MQQSGRAVARIADGSCKGGGPNSLRNTVGFELAHPVVHATNHSIGRVALRDELTPGLREFHMGSTAVKTRNWVGIVYPESAPDGWMDALESVKAFVSPLHDKDVTPDGELKKPHYHVLVMFEGPKTEAAANRLFSKFNGPRIEPVDSLQAMARYLCHLDQHDKHRYNTADVRQYGGVDYFETIETNSDRDAIIREMQEWCDENRCCSFSRLARHARESEYEWFKALNRYATYPMREYVKGLRFELSQVDEIDE